MAFKTALLLGAVSLVGCGRSAPAHVAPVGAEATASPALITDVGTYQHPSRPQRLEISVDAKEIVRYQVTDDKTGKIFVSGNAGGNFSRWYFLWSPDARLWVYSGDTGCFVWTPQTDGTYQQATLTDDNELLREMPAQFFDALPSTLRTRWAGKPAK